MKQHAIPQNILDIEFKLFTKFTVREFVYMALGIGFGGIFLYFFTKGQLPGVIAIPIFVVSSGIGLFLGLVPINDQKADVFLRNYIWAITNPTQRVWKNEKLLNKDGIEDKMDITQGDMQRNPNQGGSAKIVGAGPVNANQFIENEKLNQLDKEEAERLASITNEVPYTPVSNTPAPALPSPSPTPINTQSTTPTTTVPTPSPIKPNSILISRETLGNFQTVSGSGNQTLGFQIIDKDIKPNKEAVVALKGRNGTVVFAQRTDANGTVTLTQQLPADQYKLVVQSQNKTYSNIELVLDGKPFPIIKLMLG